MAFKAGIKEQRTGWAGGIYSISTHNSASNNNIAEVKEPCTDLMKGCR